MPVITYRSTDAGAPTLPNANGALNAVLKACLVDGYPGKAAAGWTAPFTGTNLIAFRQGAGGNNRYLRVFDGGLDTYSSRCVKVRAYESMTAISTGTGPCPTVGQVAGNGANFAYFGSGRAETVSQWVLVANSSFFHLIVEQADAPQLYPEYMAFGKFTSDLPGDTFNDVLVAGALDGAGFTGYVDSASYPGVWCMRSDTGALGAVVCNLMSEARTSNTGTVGTVGSGSTFSPYPDRVRSGLIQSQLTIHCDGYRRGRIPGLWEQHHPPADIGGHRTTWSGGPGPLVGKSFQIFGPIAAQAVGSNAHVTLELSDTWT